jgi:hypothetical protein
MVKGSDQGGERAGITFHITRAIGHFPTPYKKARLPLGSSSVNEMNGKGFLGSFQI